MVVFNGLPESLQARLSSFSSEEKLQHPVAVISSILRHTYKPMQDLKSNDEVSQLIFQAANIKQDNPMKYYVISSSECEIGGYSRVFTCERRTDGKKFALKFIKPKTRAQITDVVNEIGLMQLCPYASVVKCEQAFLFASQFWIVLELMDGGAFTSMLEEMQGSYSEKFCRYTLYKVVQGLLDLHR